MAQEPITLFKGDDSNAFGARTITIRLTTDLDLTSATARFDLLSYSVQFSNAVTRTKTFTITFTAAQTAILPLGTICGKLRLFDSSGRVITACCPIPFRVMLPGGGPGSSFWKEYARVVSVEVCVGVDYAFVFNKPTVDGVIVEGDKDAHDYGLAKLTDIQANESVVTGYYYNGKFYSDSAHTKEITGAVNKIYIDLTTNTQYRWDANLTAYVSISASITVDDHLDGNSTNPVQNKVTKAAVDTLTEAVATKANLAALKAAFTDPSEVKLSPASIRQYLITLYNSIQSLSN